jgi:hypothetical protein
MGNEGVSQASLHRKAIEGDHRHDRAVWRLHNLFLVQLATLDLLRGGAFVRAAASIVAWWLCASLLFGFGISSQFNGGAVQVAQIAIEEEG